MGFPQLIWLVHNPRWHWIVAQIFPSHEILVGGWVLDYLEDKNMDIWNCHFTICSRDLINLWLYIYICIYIIIYIYYRYIVFFGRCGGLDWRIFGHFEMFIELFDRCKNNERNGWMCASHDFRGSVGAVLVSSVEFYSENFSEYHLKCLVICMYPLVN